MKSLKYAVGIISLSVALFSGNVQADGVTIVKLSSAPTVKVNKTIILPHRGMITTRVNNKRGTKRIHRTYRKSFRPHKIRHNQYRLTRERNRRIMNRAKLRAKKINARRMKSPVRYYYVQRGDSLFKIAKKYHVTVKHILHLNNLKSPVIIVGRKLKI